MTDFVCSSCHKCGKLLIIVGGEEWYDAEYTCPCGTTFTFKSQDVDE